MWLSADSPGFVSLRTKRVHDVLSRLPMSLTTLASAYLYLRGGSFLKDTETSHLPKCCETRACL